VENKRKTVAHIKELGKAGFVLERRTVCSIAYRFAVELNLPQIQRRRRNAGHDWLRSFMDRNSDLFMQQSEGLSVARVHGMNRTYVSNYFNTLHEILFENYL
jgi:hypothetical protein